MSFRKGISMKFSIKDFFSKCEIEGYRLKLRYPAPTNDQIYRQLFQFYLKLTTQKLKFSIKEVSCGFSHIYRRNLYWKTSFFVQWKVYHWNRRLCAVRKINSSKLIFQRRFALKKQDLYLLNYSGLKACVRYFLLNICFFTKW